MKKLILIILLAILVSGCTQQESLDYVSYDACKEADGNLCADNEVCLTKTIEVGEINCCSDGWRCKNTNSCCAVPENATIENMALIPAGTFIMGREIREGWLPMADPTQFDDELPAHEVYVDAFYIDKYEITNQQFKEFVDATGYVTDAEDHGGSTVMVPANQADEVLLGADIGWKYVEGATWYALEGPGSDITNRMDHPVVHVSWNDANAYAKWVGKRLPTEAEWEKAARGGTRTNWFWSDSIEDSTYKAGNYQNMYAEHRIDYQYPEGVFDGYDRTAPVGSFLPNDYGLYDTSGNVFEWTADWYQYDYYNTSQQDNPKGPDEPVNESEPTKVVKGGGWYMCECYTRPANRQPSEIMNHRDGLGFRLSLDA